MSVLAAASTVRKPMPGVVEDRLGDHRPAHDGRDGQPEQGHDGDQGVAQGVAVEDPPGGGTFGPGRADVVLGHGLHHGGAHVAAERGDGDGGQRDLGEHEGPGIAQDVAHRLAL